MRGVRNNPDDPQNNFEGFEKTVPIEICRKEAKERYISGNFSISNSNNSVVEESKNSHTNGKQSKMEVNEQKDPVDFLTDMVITSEDFQLDGISGTDDSLWFESLTSSVLSCIPDNIFSDNFLALGNEELPEYSTDGIESDYLDYESSSRSECISRSSFLSSISHPSDSCLQSQNVSSESSRAPSECEPKLNAVELNDILSGIISKPKEEKEIIKTEEVVTLPKAEIKRHKYALQFREKKSPAASAFHKKKLNSIKKYVCFQ